MTMAAAVAAAAAGRLANCRRDSIHHHPARFQQSRELNKNIHADQYKVENNPATNLDVYKVETTLNAQCPSLQEPASSPIIRIDWFGYEAQPSPRHLSNAVIV
jgi:hypothetical protein